MNKKIVLLILSIAVFCASALLFDNAYSTADVATNVDGADEELIRNVVEIERSLILAQGSSLTFDEYKAKISPYIHPLYQDSYFGDIQRSYDKTGGYLAASSQPPIYEYVSKVYSGGTDTAKSIFVKIPLEGTTSQNAKLYVFKKDNDAWKIFSVTNYILIIERNEPKRIIEKFASYNGNPIEYEYIKVYE